MHSPDIMAKPGTGRVYSNFGFQVGRRRAGHRLGTPAGHVHVGDAGLGDVQVREIDSDPINFYYVARK